MSQKGTHLQCHSFSSIRIGSILMAFAVPDQITVTCRHWSLLGPQTVGTIYTYMTQRPFLVNICKNRAEITSRYRYITHRNISYFLESRCQICLCSIWLMFGHKLISVRVRLHPRQTMGGAVDKRQTPMHGDGIGVRSSGTVGILRGMSLV